MSHVRFMARQCSTPSDCVAKPRIGCCLPNFSDFFLTTQFIYNTLLFYITYFLSDFDKNEEIMAITITGQCINPDQSPIATGVDVRALTLADVLIATVRSDGTGRFTFSVENQGNPVKLTFSRVIKIVTDPPQLTMNPVQTNGASPLNLKKVNIPI